MNILWMWLRKTKTQFHFSCFKQVSIQYTQPCSKTSNRIMHSILQTNELCEEKKVKEIKMKYVFLALCISLLYLAFVFYVSQLMCMRRKTKLFESSILAREKCQKMLCSCRSIHPEYVFVYQRVCLANNVTRCVWSVQRKSDLLVPWLILHIFVESGISVLLTFQKSWVLEDTGILDEEKYTFGCLVSLSQSNIYIFLHMSVKKEFIRKTRVTHFLFFIFWTGINVIHSTLPKEDDVSHASI